jgi:UDP-N-acetylglucosamine 2-epimerase (non-hydrolysing)
MPKVLVVVGARPNYMKAAPILEAAKRRRKLDVALVHTGQHYDPELSSLLMNDLGMPEPDHRLDVGRGTALSQIGAILTGLESVCAAQRPDGLVVVGDVNSTLAGALTANKLSIPLVHVEAGLRSHDPGMPEEWNRRVTDLLADVLLCTERSGVEALLAEGKRDDQVFLVGNGMIDTLLRLREKARQAKSAERLGVGPRYALVTLHRPSNVDDPVKLSGLLDGALLPISRELPLVFPVHPRTRPRLDAALAGRDSRGLVVCPPLGYVDFVSLMEGAALVLTDSGGVQEETTVLGVPCLTVRENTERPVTVEMGTNRLVGTDPREVLDASLGVLRGEKPSSKVPPLWDGMAGERAVAIVGAFLENGPTAAADVARAVGAKVGREGLRA